MEMLKKIAWWLMVIGAINWGLVGVGMLAGGDWNLVKMIFGSMPWLEAIIYVLVGLSAIYKLFGCSNCCKATAAPAAPMQ